MIANLPFFVYRYKKHPKQNSDVFFLKTGKVNADGFSSRRETRRQLRHVCENALKMSPCSNFVVALVLPPCSMRCSTQCSTSFMPYLCDIFFAGFFTPVVSLCGTFQTARDPAQGPFRTRPWKKRGKRETGDSYTLPSRNLSEDWMGKGPRGTGSYDRRAPFFLFSLLSGLFLLPWSSFLPLVSWLTSFAKWTQCFINNFESHCI